MKPRLVFFGSSDFSIPLLEACLESPVEIVLVITTPDQKKGRGLQTQPNIVRQFCLDRSLACEAFETLKNSESLAQVKSLQPDIFVVASYGKIIPSAWLEVPRQARLNVHPSLLPRHRGAAPLNWPILEGDQETGLCIAEITAKLDSGDIFYCKKIPLQAHSDSHTLGQQLAGVGKEALADLLARLSRAETLPRQPQDESSASYARKLQKDDGRLSWKDSAETFDRKIRGLKPWPGAFILLDDQPLVLLKASLESLEPNPAAEPGTLLAVHKDGSISLQTGRGVLRLEQVKPAGKGMMTAADFIRGRRLQPGARLGGGA